LNQSPIKITDAQLAKNPQSPGRRYLFNDATWKLYEDYKARGEAE
jgi:hypothetical protein